MTSLLNWFKLVYFLNILEVAAQVSSKDEAMRVGAMSIIQHSDLQKRRIKSPKKHGAVEAVCMYVASVVLAASYVTFVHSYVAGSLS